MAYQINQENCSGCHRCRVECPVGAIRIKNTKYWIDPGKCVSCGHCETVCHNEAVSNPDAPVIPPAQHDPVSYDCDIVIIGAGASGMSAAAAASERGCRVLVLEKGKEIGGSAWYAHVFRSLWSKWHEEAGLEDPRDRIYREFMEKTKGSVNGKLLRRILDADADFINWLIEKHNLGDDFSFGPAAFGGYGPLPVYEWDYNRKRIDTTIGPGGVGWWMVNKLLSILEANGGRVLYHTAAKKLILDDSGALAGVTAEDAGGRIDVSCRACIIAAGSFTRNREIMAKMQPKFYDDGDGDGVHIFTHPNCTGDGITMCEQIGADVDWYNKRAAMFGPMRHPFGICSIAASRAVAFDIDREGNLLSPGTPGEEISSMTDVPGRYSWGIASESAMADAISRNKGRPPDVPGINMDALYDNWREELDTELAWETMYRADTLEQLAEKIGIPGEKLRSANAAYEASLSREKEEEERKTVFRGIPRVPLGEGPYYAFYRKMFHENSIGGVVIDENTNVLRGGRPVPGLYAAGDGTRGIMVPGRVGVRYIEGTVSALTFALTSGFVAGGEAAGYAVHTTF